MASTKSTLRILISLLVFQLSVLSSQAQSVTPQPSPNGYSFTVHNVYLEVDPKSGARISSLKIHGEELLYLNKANNTWGSTFWSSPQSAWNWPPPAELDKDAYTATMTGTMLSLKSNTHQATGFQFIKNIFANLEDTSITIQYVMINKKSSAVQAAPWEVTRFPGGGITFFPKGPAGQGITGEIKSMVQEANGVCWFNYDSTKVPSQESPKYFSDGSEGWLAHVRRNGNLVIKQFTDAAFQNKAPNPENEIEHYLKPDKTHQEVEQQGAYTTIAPGDSLVWNVKWLVRKVPANIRLVAQNDVLANYARSVVRSSITALPLLQNTGDLQLFPNPASHQLNVFVEQGTEALSIADARGITVDECKDFTPGTMYVYHLPSLPAGKYFLKSMKNGAYLVKSFVIESR